jgi:hypothetical protein
MSVSREPERTITRKPQPGRNVRLRQLQADMKPFKFFSLPSLGLKLYWGK